MISKKCKYIAVYNGIPIPFNDKLKFAKKLMGFKIVKEGEGYNVFINEKIVARYGLSYTIKQIEDEQMSTFFRKNTYPNLFFYSLIDTSN